MAERGEVLGGVSVDYVSVPERESCPQLTLHFEQRQIECGVPRLFLCSEQSFVTIEEHRRVLVDALAANPTKEVSLQELISLGIPQAMASPLAKQAVQWINQAFIFEGAPIEIRLGPERRTVQSVRLASHVQLINTPQGDLIPRPPQPESEKVAEAPIVEDAPDMMDELMGQVETVASKVAEAEAPVEWPQPESIVIEAGELSPHHRGILSLLIRRYVGTEPIQQVRGESFDKLWAARIDNPSMPLHELLGMSEPYLQLTIETIGALIEDTNPDLSHLIDSATAV